MPEQHDMVLLGLAEPGVEEWFCPTCRRRMLLRWPPPGLERTVLDEGDPSAVHAGVKGNAGMRAAVSPRDSGVTAAEVRWLRDHGIEWDDGLAS